MLNPSAWPGLLLLGAIWGSSYVLMRLGAAEFGPFALAGLRALVAAAVLCPLAWLQVRAAQANSTQEPAQAGRTWPWTRLGSVALLGITHSALPFVLFNWAALHLDAGMCGVLGAAAPLFAALFATTSRTEAVRGTQWLGMGLGLVGVMGLAAAQAEPTTAAEPSLARWAAGACLLAAALYGWSANHARRHLLQTPSIVVAAGGQAAAALVLVVPMMLYWPSSPPSPTGWLAALLLALLCTSLAFVLFYSLVRRLGPTRAQVISLLVPVFAIAWGWLLLAERPTWGMAAACATVLLGILGTAWRRHA